MKDVNKVILIGRLGADPILRETKTGGVVVHFPVATSRRIKSTEPTENEEVKPMAEETQWHRIVAWGRQGETCAQYLKKGQKVYVEGTILSRRYEAKDGSEKTSFEVIAETVSFLGGNRSETSLSEKEGEEKLMERALA
ncbi:MAG: single-stranded DNA-binding protein [Cryobacterium sp.]|nr:single-stranded DNA-binding protein [Oligoflexia bacterium]